MNDWGWQTRRPAGIWRYGAGVMRPLIVAAPFLTVVVLLLLLFFIGGTLTAEKGVLFDLPEGEALDGAAAKHVAIVIPRQRETLVIFDDSRYILGRRDSTDALAEQFAAAAAKDENKTLLVLADRRVSGGQVFELAGIARRGGMTKVLFAEKRKESAE